MREAIQIKAEINTGRKKVVDKYIHTDTYICNIYVYIYYTYIYVFRRQTEKINIMQTTT